MSFLYQNHIDNPVESAVLYTLTYRRRRGNLNTSSKASCVVDSVFHFVFGKGIKGKYMAFTAFILNLVELVYCAFIFVYLTV